MVLVILIYAALLGVRFGLAGFADLPGARDPVPVSADAVMALPPKPEGLGRSSEGGEGSAGLDEAACLGMATAVRDVCWQALARQEAPADTDAALGRCDAISEVEIAWECRADVAETIAPARRAEAETICLGITPQKWRGQCHFGLALAVVATDSAWALARCDQSEAFRDFCRHDVVGELALVDLPAATAFCAREEGDELTRKTCWHGIGKYLARRDVSEATAACGVATPAWRGNCLHGVGWGAAERDPDAALGACADQGPLADNCRQGVAHQQKRGDPARAIALCEAIATETIRSRCLSFVRR